MRYCTLLCFSVTLLFSPLICAGETHGERYEESIPHEMRYLFDSDQFLVKVFGSSEGDTYRFGSGFLYQDDEGRWSILTNSHVVGSMEAKEVFVWFYGGQKALKVSVIGRDPVLDLALLEVPIPLPLNIKSVVLGEESDIAVGARVYALGFPYGIKSVAYGHINALEAPRGIVDASAVSHIYLSSQAPILPGNSGGPLIYFRSGEALDGDSRIPVVIGLNTKISPIGLMSFSIMVQYFDRIFPRLKAEEVVHHASPGFMFDDIEKMHALEYETILEKDTTEGRGIMITKVERRDVDIQSGDIITAVFYNGNKVQFNNARELADYIFFDLRPQEAITLRIQRDGQEVNQTVYLTEILPSPSTSNDQ